MTATATIDRFRSSTRGWMLGTLAGWGTLGLIGAGLVLTILFYANGQNAWLWPLVTVAGVAILVWKWLGNIAASYELTEDRLILHKGIFAKSIDEIELYRIKDVRIDFTLINQIAKIGRITIASSDETTSNGPLVLRDIERARERREVIRELVNAARIARGVREFDMAHDHI